MNSLLWSAPAPLEWRDMKPSIHPVGRLFHRSRPRLAARHTAELRILADAPFDLSVEALHMPLQALEAARKLAAQEGGCGRLGTVLERGDLALGRRACVDQLLQGLDILAGRRVRVRLEACCQKRKQTGIEPIGLGQVTPQARANRRARSGSTTETQKPSAESERWAARWNLPVASMTMLSGRHLASIRFNWRIPVVSLPDRRLSPNGWR